jgi:transposase
LYQQNLFKYAVPLNLERGTDMSRGHLSMRKIREILRLKRECLCSNRLIARSIQVSHSTVKECLERAEKAKLTWPLPKELNDTDLKQLLYPATLNAVENKKKAEIDWVYIHQELKRKSVTLMLLWEEYKEKNSNGIGYSQFCERYRNWRGALDVWMRQSHKWGEKCFVDYAGMKIPVVIHTATGEIREAEIFVATLGASNFTFVEATWTQQLPDWISSHRGAFEFFGGVPEIIVPDNLKSGISKAHRYEPDLNPTYQDMAMHYGVAIIPARSATPQDKAKVENAVLQAERHILAKLRNRNFFSLYEVNEAIKPLLKALNERLFQKLPGSRQSQFDTHEKSNLKPLPNHHYVYSQWKRARAGLDYHIEIENHYYSVPYLLAKHELDIRYNDKTVEIFHKGKRVASHIRAHSKHRHTTVTEHMPKNHQAYAQWTPERIIHWGKKIGHSTSQLLEKVMKERAHPQQGFRACLGILRLSKNFGEQRLEAACLRALTIGAFSYKSVESILKKGLDKKPLDPSQLKETPLSHEYVRGRDYFN